MSYIPKNEQVPLYTEKQLGQQERALEDETGQKYPIHQFANVFPVKK